MRHGLMHTRCVLSLLLEVRPDARTYIRFLAPVWCVLDGATGGTLTLWHARILSFRNLLSSTCSDFFGIPVFHSAGPEVCSPSKKEQIDAAGDSILLTEDEKDNKAKNWVSPTMRARPSSLAFAGNRDKASKTRRNLGEDARSSALDTETRKQHAETSMGPRLALSSNAGDTESLRPDTGSQGNASRGALVQGLFCRKVDTPRQFQEAPEKKEPVNVQDARQEMKNVDTKRDSQANLTLPYEIGRDVFWNSSISPQTSSSALHGPATFLAASMPCASLDVSGTLRQSPFLVHSSPVVSQMSPPSPQRIIFAAQGPGGVRTSDALGNVQQRPPDPIRRAGMKHAELFHAKARRSPSFHQQADDFYRSVAAAHGGARMSDRGGHGQAQALDSRMFMSASNTDQSISAECLGCSVNRSATPRAASAVEPNVAFQRSPANSGR